MNLRINLGVIYSGKKGIAIIDELDKKCKDEFEHLKVPLDDNQSIEIHNKELD